MAANTSPAFVLVAADGTEIARYTQKGSANRAAKGPRNTGSVVRDAAEFDAEVRAAKAAAATPAPEVVEAPAAVEAPEVEAPADEIATVLASVPARKATAPAGEGKLRPAGTAGNGVAVALFEERRTTVRPVRLGDQTIGEVRQDGRTWTGYSVDGVKMTDPAKARREAAVALADAVLAAQIAEAVDA